MSFKTPDEYLASLPNNVKIILEEVRETIRESVPEAQETMSYGVPAFKKDGKTIIYAAFKTHIGLYPTPAVIEAFKDDLKGYETSKGAIKFPLNQPIPLSLIKRITEYRMK